MSREVRNKISSIADSAVFNEVTHEFRNQIIIRVGYSVSTSAFSRIGAFIDREITNEMQKWRNEI